MINTHAAVGLAAAIVAGIATWQIQSWRYEAQLSQLREHHTAEIQAANDRARQIERDMNQRLTEARNAAAKREQDLRRAGDILRDQFDGLREQTEAIRRGMPTATVDAARDAAATATALLESCAREYQALARAADGHASDTMTLQESWPRR